MQFVFNPAKRACNSEATLMPSTNKLWIVAYDSPNDKRRSSQEAKDNQVDRYGLRAALRGNWNRGKSHSENIKGMGHTGSALKVSGSAAARRFSAPAVPDGFFIRGS